MHQLWLCATTLFVLVSVAGRPEGASVTPEDVGLRFDRLALKTRDTLAMKPGGPTERIEVQSTDDHIDYVVKAYELKNANAAEVHQLILNAVNLEGGYVDRIAPGSAVTCSEALDNIDIQFSGESILVVTAPEWMIPFLDETIRILDRKDLEAAAWGTGCVIVRPRHRRPSELAALISESAASGIEVLVADDSRNVLYLDDITSYFAGDIEALGYFDSPPAQIVARVRIFEIDESHGRDVGLDWYAWKKSIQDGHLTFQWDNSFKPGSYDLDLQSVTGELSFNPLLATEFLNYLANEGKAKVLTDTRVTLINGRPGTVNAVREIPYVIRGWIDHDVADSPQRDVPGALDPLGVIKEFVEGVTVELAPTIGTETTEISVRASVSSHVGYTPNQSVPIIAVSDVETGVVVEDGRPAVIGGLTRTSVVGERSGFPLLKDIPGVRYFFSREVKRDHKTHVLITILPLGATPREEMAAAGGE